jgi:hypothetical protein
MLSMGAPFYVFVLSIIGLLAAAVLTCIVYSQKAHVGKPALPLEGGQDEA